MENSISKKEKRALVLDTSAFFAGFDPFSISDAQYTVPMVKEEIKGSSMPWVRFKMAVENGKLKVKVPIEVFLKNVRASASMVGDVRFLSEADFQVLALALELKANGYFPLIVTDDYAIQNVADQLNIRFASLATFGIRFRLQWIRYCPACHKRYAAEQKISKCQVCGTELKRKPLRKKLLKP